MATHPSFPSPLINFYRFYRTPNYACSQAEGEGEEVFMGYMTAAEAESLAARLEAEMNDEGRYSVHWVRELAGHLQSRIDELLSSHGRDPHSLFAPRP